MSANGSGRSQHSDDAGIVIERVTKSFGHGTDRTSALGAISLSVARGEFVTIIGPSGCGKSTLLRIIAGLIPPEAGGITIFGSSVSAAKAHKRIGFVPQSPALLPWRTVLDNVRLPQQVNRQPDSSSDRDAEMLLAAVGLSEVAHRRPNQLSGGMQQRVAIARAFALDHSLLLMDEPFAALDELNRERTRQQLLDLWSTDAKTVIFVTHSVTEAVILSDRVIVMSARPGAIRAVIPVDLPRPRDEAVEFSAEFRSIELAVRQELRAGWRESA